MFGLDSILLLLKLHAVLLGGFMKRQIALLVIIIITSLAASPLMAGTSTETVSLTETERAFIDAHPVIRLGVDPQFVPFEFIDIDGSYKGIAADYLAIISEKTGLAFDVAEDLSWQEAYDRALTDELDVLPAVSMTQERQQHFLFSDAYYYFKRVIVTRSNESGITGMEDLSNTTVAVQRNSSHHSYLLAYPDINLSLYNSVEAALTAVASGSENAFVGNLATTHYLIQSNALTNLKFIAFEAEKQQGIHFAVRNDWPELVSIINKTLQTITEEERIAINRRWIDLDTTPDYGPLLRVLLIAGILILVVLIVSFYWIIRLRREVSKRILIQADLEKAKREAEEANEFKSNFMARMSHEIRTPLNAITGMAYLTKKTSLTQAQRMYVDRITQAANNMLSIINDILDFSKIEAGKVALEKTSFSLDQVIQDVVNIIAYKIDSQGVGLKLAKYPQVPNWFFGDPKRIEQVLLNLMNNAAKFTSRGEVSLNIRLKAKEHDRYYLSFSVQDTGIGMTKEQVDSLFQPFQQGDSSITRRFGGSGLGLSIVKNLVELMDGRVEVYSTPGEGSTFIAHLTLQVDDAKEKDLKKRFTANQFKDIHVLVLDKNGMHISLIDSYLTSFGMHSEMTNSQDSAMRMLEEAGNRFSQAFDLLIVDYETPSEGGLRFVTAVRENKKIVRQPKCILLLPLMREDLFDQLTQYDVDAGVGKPILPSVLLNAIVDVFDLRAISAAHTTDQADMSEQFKALAETKPFCVLLAEDNNTNQLIASSILQQASIRTIIANNGQEAVDLFKENQHDIDLTLMDLHMPVMNGYDAALAIHEINADLPIIAMTADVILGVREKCEASGMKQYISKPFDPNYFIQTVKETIWQSRQNRSEPSSDTTHFDKMVPAKSAARSSEILDVNAGLANMGGQQALYKQVLQAYYEETLIQ